MFKIKDASIPLRWPVLVTEPGDMGAARKSEFTAQFVLIKRSEFDTLSVAGDKALMARVLVGWSGIQDEDGNELEFSDEARDLLVDMPPITTALARAYINFMQGVVSKN